MMIEQRSAPQFIIITILFFLLITVPQLRAQTGEESRHIRLTWTGDEYALRYEVVLEKEENGEYSEILRRFTDTFFIDVSLPPGNYRCQVIPYDYLEKPADGSQWFDFEVQAP
ncbi:MAG: hypothetical protein FWF26_04935, partial [Treponema sp.]|nr:hypothetical protein [Treponema sp.]